MPLRILNLSCDPGVECAIAAWDLEDWEGGSSPIACELFEHIPPEEYNWGARCHLTCAWIESWLNGLNLKSRFDPGIAYVEQPQYIPGGRGDASASSGDLVKLCVMTGRIIQVFDKWGFKIEMVPIGDWKGQTKKSMTMRRIRKRLPAKFCKTLKRHQWDAVGIGLHAKGML